VFTTVTNQAKIVDERAARSAGLAARPNPRPSFLPSQLRRSNSPTHVGTIQEELASAARWIFVGYSPADADVHLRDVLRHALRIRDKNHEATTAVWVGRSSPSDPPGTSSTGGTGDVCAKVAILECDQSRL
jgi:hypothetical protein